MSPENRRLLVAALLFAVLAPSIFYLTMDMFVRQMLYPAPPVAVPSPPPTPLEELVITTSGGDEVVGWLRERSGPGEAGPAVLFFHGNGENLATLHWSGLFDEFHAAGASVLAIDYPGYGRSTGRPSEASLTAAGIAAFAALGERFPDRPLYIAGWSLGAAAAMQTAVMQQERLAGLALLSPWHDLPSLASRFFPKMLVGMALKDRYHSGDAAADLRLPALVVHGASDPIIPVEQGRRLAGLLPEGSRWVQLQGVGHNDLMARRETWRELIAWLGE